MGEVMIGVCAAAAGAVLGLLGLAVTLGCLRRNREKRRGQPSGGRTGAKPEMTKRVIWVCLFNGFAWVWCSYILAYLDKVQIAESLSQVAVTEIIGVVLAYCIKSAVENLSKNNRWPDKCSTAGDGEPPGAG